MQNELTVVSPWYLTLPRKTMKDKKYSLNLNTYATTNYTINNLCKRIYKYQIQPQLRGCVLKTPVEVSIQVYSPDLRKRDKSNIYAVSAKFLYDAMTEFGVIPDDNDDYLKKETILPSKYDKNNGRIEFTFRSIEETDENDFTKW